MRPRPRTRDPGARALGPGPKPRASTQGLAKAQGTVPPQRGGHLSQKKAFRVQSTKFVPRKMFCASHPGCQDATLSDTLVTITEYLFPPLALCELGQKGPDLNHKEILPVTNC